MKKLVIAMMALSAVVLSFTSCEKSPKADPATKPVAGHTYQYTKAETGGYFKVIFHTNYKCTLEVKKDKDAIPVSNNLYVWDMEGSTKIEIRYAENASVDGVLMGGVLLYNGLYNPETKRVTLTLAEDPQYVYPCDFVE